MVKHQKKIHNMRKHQKVYTKDHNNSTQAETNVDTFSASETFMGGHIKGTIHVDDVATSNGILAMALVKVPHNKSASNLSISDGGDFYLSEEDVLWSDLFRGSDTTEFLIRVDDKIKTKRKFSKDDKLVLIGKANGSGDYFRVALRLISFFGS